MLVRPPPKYCPNCGARVLRPGIQAACDYCESGLEISRPPRVEERLRRFERIEADPGLPRLLERPIGGGGHLAGSLFMLLVLGGMAAFGVVLATKMAPQGGGFVIVPLVFVAIAIAGFVKAMGNSARFASDPGRAVPAIVVDERVEVSGRSDGPSTTRNYATLEDRDGQRRELSTSASVAGKIAPGDAGIAYERGDVLLDFARIDA